MEACIAVIEGISLREREMGWSDQQISDLLLENQTDQLPIFRSDTSPINNTASSTSNTDVSVSSTRLWPVHDAARKGREQVKLFSVPPDEHWRTFELWDTYTVYLIVVL